MHKLELSTPLGPEYVAPCGSGTTVNAAKEMRYLEAQAHYSRTKMATDSQPQLQVDVMYAVIIHGFWPRELNDWTPKAIRSGKG